VELELPILIGSNHKRWWVVFFLSVVIWLFPGGGQEKLMARWIAHLFPLIGRKEYHSHQRS
jgi:hypothetical protein